MSISNILFTLSRKREDFNKISVLDGWLSENEGALLYLLASEKYVSGGVVVEVGSYKGKSTCYLALAAKDNNFGNKIYAVDPLRGKTLANQQNLHSTYGAFRRNVRKLGFKKYIHLIRKPSIEVAEKWRKPISLLHIDALHEYVYIKKDLENWIPFLKDNGIVVCHDAFSPNKEVFQAFKEEIIDSNKFKFIGVSDSQIFAIKGTTMGILSQINRFKSRYFISLAANLWQNEQFSYGVREFIVKKLLKLFYINIYMFCFIVNKYF